MADVFLSYARKERERALPIKQALEALGLEVFFDVDGLDGGDLFPDVLDREVKSAGAVVSLWSPWSLTRPWIRLESRIGKDRGVLIPVDIAPLDPLHDLPVAFYDDQRVDLVDFSGDTTDDGWVKLVRALARTLKRPELLEREAQSPAHSNSEAEELRRELELLKAQLGNIGTQNTAGSASAPVEQNSASSPLPTRDRIRDYLVGLAKAGRTATYAEAVQSLRCTEQQLWGLLNLAAEDNKKRREPFLCALIVDESGVPGPGFFRKFAPGVEHGSSDAATEHARLLGEVFAYDWAAPSRSLHDLRLLVIVVLVLTAGAGAFYHFDPLNVRVPSEPGGLEFTEITDDVPTVAPIEGGAKQPGSVPALDLGPPPGLVPRQPPETLTDTAPGGVPVIEAPFDVEPGVDPAVRTEAIRGLQRALQDMGLYTSFIDGDPGPGTRLAVSRFVSEFGGTQPDLATSSLSDIADLTGRVEREVIAQRERDNAAWRVAVGADTISAYRAYLADYPSGMNASAARSRIEALTLPPEPSYRAGQVFRDTLSGGGQGPEMVVIPSGSFTMGSPETEDGHDRDEILRTIDIRYQFAVGKYEVTWAEWEACVADGGCIGSGPEGAGGDNGWGRGSRPVINVSWHGAQAYVQWLSRKTGERYRLLSEAEWEYAARAVTTIDAQWTRFSWGNGDPTCSRGARNGAVFNSCEGRGTEPVGFSAANAFGVHDMHGNVREWVEDCYDYRYSENPTDGSALIVNNCSRRVLRGGAWSSSPRNLRSAERFKDNPSERDSRIGFRVARTLVTLPSKQDHSDSAPESPPR